MSATVGVRELRQNLSKHLERVKAGEALVVTERGREVARLVPSGPTVDPLAKLAERGARLATRDPADVLAELAADETPVEPGPSSAELLDALREERF